MAEDDDDLFMFSGAQPVRFGSSLEATSEQEDAIKKLLNEGSMVNDGDYEETPTARRARKRTASGRREEFVELLTTGQVVDSPKKEKEEKKYDKHDELNDSSKLSLSSSSFDSLSPKSPYSPRMPTSSSDEMSFYAIHAVDPETARLLDQAEAALHQLKHKPDTSTSTINDSIISSEALNISTNENMLTVRVRCRGKLHKFDIKQTDPLSLVANKLASELNVDQLQVLFRRKDEDLSHSADPHSLSLSTLDIIDAFIFKNKATYSINEDRCNSDSEQIKIKIQTAKKSSYFTISKSQSLEKVLRQFAAELGLSMNSVQFTFDGEKFATSKTALDLDLEDDDVIDARVSA